MSFFCFPVGGGIAQDFFFPVLQGFPWSLWGVVTSAVKMSCIALGSGYPLYNPNWVALVLEHHPCGGMWWVVGLLAYVFLALISCSQKLLATLLHLRDPSCLYQALWRLVGEEWMDKVGSCVALFSGFKCNEYRAFSLESCYCPLWSAQQESQYQVGHRR